MTKKKIQKDKKPTNNKHLTDKKQYLNINKCIYGYFLNIKKISNNLSKELGSIFDKKIGKNSKLDSISNNKINKNLYKELKLTFVKKIGKSLNKILKSSFIFNNIHLRKKIAISITKTSSKVYKPKIYNRAITNPIYSIR